RLRGSDLVEFPLLDESKPHYVSLARIEKFHPVHEFECRRSRAGLRCRHTLDRFFAIHYVNLTRAFPIVPEQGIPGYPEKPGAEGGAFANLSCLEIDGQHHFLGEILRQSRFATARLVESKQLGSEEV